MDDLPRPAGSSGCRLPVLMTARSTAEALVVSSLLREAGVPVYVAGQALMDEFGIARQALNLDGVTLCVPGEHLMEARRLVVEARLAGRRLEQEHEDRPPDGRDDEDGAGRGP